MVRIDFALMRTHLALLALMGVLACAATSADDLSSPAGLWEPLDSSTGKPLGLIRIFERDGRWFGRIEPLPGDDVNERCTHCTDDRKGQPIIGLVIMRNLRREGDEYVGGDILDPDTGKVYGCKFHLANGGHQLIMRGYLGISLLGSSQTWRRVEQRGNAPSTTPGAGSTPRDPQRSQ
jgi:uncharacterized protein (DUF2147 family)